MENKSIKAHLAYVQASLSLGIDRLITNDMIVGKMQQIEQDIIETVNNGGKVIFTGIGKNVYAAQKLAASYSSIGIPSFFLDAVHAVHGDIGVLNNNDLLICMSKSGNTAELITTLKHIHNNRNHFKFKMIGIDCNPDKETGFDLYCDYSLSIPTSGEMDKLGMVPTISLLMIQIIGDTIGVSASEKLGFGAELFGLNHPGGSIGKVLNK